MRQDEIPLLDVNLTAGVAPATPRPVHVLTQEALLERAREKDVAYLRFQPPEIASDEVTLTLEALMASADPDRRSLGLGAVRVTFRRAGEDWHAVGEPVMWAA